MDQSFVLILMLSYPRLAGGDQALNDIKSRINIHNGTLKIWHLYMQQFLFERIRNSNSAYSSHQKIITKLATFSEHFISYSTIKLHLDRMVSRKIFGNYEKGKIRILIGPQRKRLQLELNVQTVTKVSGKIQSLKHFQCNAFTKHYIKFIWRFILHRKLSLNLTFYSIYFSSGEAYCYRGNISVYNVLNEGMCLQRDPDN